MIKGVDQNFSPEGTPKGYAFFAKNIIANDKLDQIVNERGNKLIEAFSNLEVTNIIGLIAFGSKIIIFRKNSIIDEIGVYDEDTNIYTSKLQRDLSFNPNFPITGRAKLNSLGQLIVTFTDNNVTPKYINLDTASPSDSLSLYNLSLTHINPYIQFDTIDGGGSLKTGVHFLSLQYVDKNSSGSSSTFSTLSPPIYITQHNTFGAFNDTKGSTAELFSNKAVKFNISNIDNSYDSIKAILITIIDDVITTAIQKEVKINGNTLSFTITGTEITSTIGLEEVLTINSSFKRVKHLATVDDQLFVADFSLPPIIDFQEVANRINLQWTSNPIFKVLTDQNNQEPYRKTANNQKTFIHDEVYAIYAQFELTDDTLTQWFTIPGRELLISQKSNSSLAGNIKFNNAIPKVFQLQSTAELIGIVGALTDPDSTAASKDSYAYGNFGVWENENETYPANFPTYGGQKVRHHKFPSLEWLKTNVYSGVTTYMHYMWDMLGLRVVLGSGSPSNLINQIRSIRIGYAKRDISNTSVLGLDIIQFGATPQSGDGSYTNNIVTSAGGNWKIQADEADNDILPKNTYIRLHSTDVSILRPSVDNIYLANQLWLRRSSLNTQYHITPSTNPYGRIMWGKDTSGYDVYTYVSNFINATSAATIASNRKFILLKNTKYIPANVLFTEVDTAFNNLTNEECLYGLADLPLDMITISGASSDADALKVDVGTQVESPNLWEETVLTLIKTPRTNFFVSYNDQQIIPITIPIAPIVGTVNLLKGEADGFICINSFLTMASAPGTADFAINLTSDAGVRCVKVYLCESRFNLNERYLTQGDYNTYFFPAGGFTKQTFNKDYWFSQIDQLNCPVNQIKLSSSFSRVNDLEQYGVYDHTKTYQSDFPYAIARSQKASRANNIEDGWRIFKPNDVFYTIRDKGLITNLMAWGTDKLLIHHERALLRTRDKAVLQTDITEISLGSGDLFALEPQEIIPTEYGYGGTQHKFSCLLCEAGYVFVDKDAGEILLYKNGDNYINIGKGFAGLFQEIFANRIVGDNPYNGTSITMVFDKLNYRLFLSLKAEDISFTASFDLIKEEWMGGHNFNPSGVVNTRKNHYSFDTQRLFKHNVGKYGEYYGIIYPSFVDIIINDEPDKEKILAAVEWISKVYKNNTYIADETITDVTIWNDHFCTGKISVDIITHIVEYEDTNTKNADRTWRFNKIKDAVRDNSLPFIDGIFSDYRPISSNIATDLAWFEEQEFRGKYFIVRLEYSNSEDKLVSLRKLLPNFRESAA